MSQCDILVVDDDESLLTLISLRLRAQGWRVEACNSAQSALIALDACLPRLVITDLLMPEMNGIELFEQIHSRYPTLPVILLTAHGTIPDAIDATRRGVFGFLTKPFEPASLVNEVERALSLNTVTSTEVEQWRRDFITCNPQMEEILREAKLAAENEIALLLQGASGTGKEFLARHVHKASPRANQPFVVLHCSALPEHLIDSELVGHKQGAFSGAVTDHQGLLQLAHGGTLFIDEVANLSLNQQIKLLQILNNKSASRLGDNQTYPVDIRIIAATQQDLNAKLANGEFREDLYYYLNVLTLRLPKLSERREDIVPLAQHFLTQAAERLEQPSRNFAQDALIILAQTDWVGNVRQLKNVIEYAVALCLTPVIPAALLHHALKDSAGPLLTLEEARKIFDRDYLTQILRLSEGNVTLSAKIAGRNRTDFYKLLHKYQLDPSTFKVQKELKEVSR